MTRYALLHSAERLAQTESDFTGGGLTAELMNPAVLSFQVPPMNPKQTREVIEGELAGARIEDVFEWLDLDKPLGSASIAQVQALQEYKRQDSSAAI